jgi:tetratricopeptide (TPR) repeat protein
MRAGHHKDKRNSKMKLPQKEREHHSNKTSKTKITGWRLWLFRLIALILIPSLFILALEFGLRITGYGFDAHAIIKCKIKGQKAYCDNIKFNWLFFPPNIAREFNPFVIPAQKLENTYRIFVFGSSAAQGTPDSAYSFSRILEVMLQEKYPTVHFEVINTAMTAINSHVVVRIAGDCVKYKPDLFVVYMGNNEVVGPYGAGTIFAPISKHLSLIHMGITLRGTRLGQLLTNLLQAINQKNIPKVWGGMGMFADKQISADDESLQVVYKNYSSNLETITKIAQKRKVPVILATVGSNLKDCPPFASLHRKDLAKDAKKSFEKLYAEAIEFDKSGQYTQAIEKYLAAADIDGQFAELQFRLGRLFFQSCQYEEAKQRYIKARELDTVRLRADNRINEIIRETAQSKSSEGVYLADAVQALEKQSPHQILGGELFYEHVHLNFKGNYILAKSVCEQVEKVLPSRVKSQSAGEQKDVDENGCMQSLAFTDLDKYRIMQSLLNEYIIFPPFTNQLYHDEQVNNLKQQAMSLKNNLGKQDLLKIASAYKNAIEKRPTDWMLHWKFGNVLMDDIKDYRTASEEYNKTLELVPHYYMTHVMLGTICGQSGDYNRAIEYFRRALKIKPTYAPAYYNIGLIYQKKGMLKESERNYKTALRLNPEHSPSYINLGFLLGRLDRVDEAIKIYRKGLEFLPDSADLHYNLGCFLGQGGQKDEAIKEFRTALKINPSHTYAKQDLEKILQESK